MTPVSFYACESYEDRAALSRAVRGIFADCFADLTASFRGKQVVIKPNLVMKKSPQAAATTHPALLEEVILFLKEYTENISVAECPGGPGTEVLLDAIYRTTGIREVCEKHGVKIHTTHEPVTVGVADGVAAKQLTLTRVMCEAEVFINLGKLKSHSLTTFTACAKNLYGAIPGLTKVEYHARFAKPEIFGHLICDINRALVPTLSVLDAVVGMEGNGPTGGTPRKIGGVLGSVSTFAVDVLGATLIGVDPKQTPIFAAAYERGLVPEDVELFGDDHTPHILSDFRLADAQRFSMLRKMPDLPFLCHLLEPRPQISARCVACGECVRLCPKNAIKIKEKSGKKRAVISKKQCIRCYCCQELCPAKAVDTKSHWILKL